MAKAYFGSRLSTNMITTPEGYLICKNVPIARTGVQQYQGREFGAENPSRIYDVTRPEREVFDAAAIASFEGKPVCDEHPDEDVTPDNYSQYMRGMCRDVHRGDGEFSNCLVGDLIIYDKGLIDKIQRGKREISCGYDCLWVQTSDSSFDQKEIRGNHIAVVEKGRAGHKVAIRDSERRTKMKSNNIIARMLAAFAKDADTSPEDLMEASKAVQAPTPEPPAPPAPPKPEVPEKSAVDAALDERLRRIEDALASLQPKEADPDALDSLEEELAIQPDADAEDEVTVPPEVINSQHEEEVAEDAQPFPCASRDAAMQAINNLKPLVAKLPPQQRKKAADSLAMLIRGQIAQDEGYASLQQAAKNSRTQDSKPVDDRDYGRAIRDRFNPHYKK